MWIDKALCTGCGRCHDICTMGCIMFQRTDDLRIVSEVDEDECVDCGVCERSGVCGVHAISTPEAKWPRSVRAMFSNPMAEHKVTKVPGRGTEEMKTNEVTGRFLRGFAGVNIELGRPGTGARLSDAGVFGRRLKQMGIQLEPKNPLASLLDPVSGDCDPEVKNEKVLSAIIEFIVPVGRLAEVLQMINEAQTEISTVVSIGLTYRCEPGDPPLEIALEAGESPYPNGKVNVGLGRPRFKEA